MTPHLHNTATSIMWRRRQIFIGPPGAISVRYSAQGRSSSQYHTCNMYYRMQSLPTLAKVSSPLYKAKYQLDYIMWVMWQKICGKTFTELASLENFLKKLRKLSISPAFCIQYYNGENVKFWVVRSYTFINSKPYTDTVLIYLYKVFIFIDHSIQTIMFDHYYSRPGSYVGMSLSFDIGFLVLI